VAKVKLAAAAPLRREAAILALSGGGMRGLFTAAALAEIERKGVDLGSSFSLLAGTSIGGILAIGLAAGLKAEVMAAAFARHGPAIFKTTLLGALKNPKGAAAALYASEPLHATVEAILGDAAQMRLRDLEKPLLVTAVEFNRGVAKIFASKSVAAPEDDLDVCLGDVALATSAAPTYFPPHRIGDRIYVDGGLIANAPDIVALDRARFGQAIPQENIRMLSVGTAAYEKRGDETIEAAGRIAWVGRHDLFSLILDAQADLSRAQAKNFLGERYYRLDKKPDRPIGLDDASPGQMKLLTSLAREAVEAFKTDGSAWRTFFK